MAKIYVKNTTGQWQSVDLAGVPEAPKDQKQYARQDGTWTEVTGGGSGSGVGKKDENTVIPPETTIPEDKKYLLKGEVFNLTEDINVGGDVKPGNRATGIVSHAEGYSTTASGNYSHAEGYSTTASGDCAHAEGCETTAPEWFSHAEGKDTHAEGVASHAEGYKTTAEGHYSHAEGRLTRALEPFSHSEGRLTTVSGPSAHAEGYYTIALGYASHAEGNHTIAEYDGQHAQGRFNTINSPILPPPPEPEPAMIQPASADSVTSQGSSPSKPEPKTIFSIGNGTSDTDRSDALKMLDDGTTWIAGIGDFNGKNPTEANSLQAIIANAGSGSSGGSGVGKKDENTVIPPEMLIPEDKKYLLKGEVFNLTEDVSAGGNTIPGNIATGNFSHAEGGGTTASGNFSHAEGQETTASGHFCSHAEGGGTTASGDCAHAEGGGTTASGEQSHAEGGGTTALGNYSHAEGDNTTAYGNQSHAEGFNYSTITTQEFNILTSEIVGAGKNQHSQITIDVPLANCSIKTRWNEETGLEEKYFYGVNLSNKKILNKYSIFTLNDSIYNIYDIIPQTSLDVDPIKLLIKVVENSEIPLGMQTITLIEQGAIGDSSHAEGGHTIAAGLASHSEGFGSRVVYKTNSGDPIGAHAEGTNTIAMGKGSHAEGGDSHAEGKYSHAEGDSNKAITVASHAEGRETTASGEQSHSEGYSTTASGDCAHAEGDSTTASGKRSHAEGYSTTASGVCSHAEGHGTTASRIASHAEGYYTEASGNSSHAEGHGTTASGYYSHAEGEYTEASGYYSHAEGDYTEASGKRSHAEGYGTTASGNSSHAEGDHTEASGYYSHAQNKQTNAASFAQTAIGYKNTPEPTPSVDSFDATKLAFIVGGGGADNNKNIFEVYFNGTVKATGTITGSAADYAEMFEWKDENPDAEDRVGRFVNLVGRNIELADSNSKNIIGIISGNPIILGDAPNSWQGMYINDKWGRPMYQDHEFEVIHQVKDEKTGEITNKSEIKKSHSRTVSQAYDDKVIYKPREERSEWGAVGMLGKLLVLHDGTLNVGDYCYPSQNGIATKSDKGWYVMDVLSNDQALVLFK